MYTRLHADEHGIVGKGVRFERFNNAKRAEVRDRVKHVHL